MRRFATLTVALVMGFAVLGVTPGKAAATDVSQWLYNATTRHFYAQVDGVTWADAEAYGVKVGGHLVTVNDQAEQDWLAAMFPQSWLWIGLNDRAREGVWVWSSGQRVTYSDWQEGQPDNWKGFDPLGEDAAVLNGDTPAWDDISERWLGSGVIETPGRPKALSRNSLPWGSHDGSPAEYAPGDMCFASGWALDPDSPTRDVTVRILATRTDIVTVPLNVWQGPAGDYRDDLAPALGVGDGTSAFWVDLRGLIAWNLPYQILVQGRDVQTGEWRTLDWSPKPIYCTQ